MGVTTSFVGQLPSGKWCREELVILPLKKQEMPLQSGLPTSLLAAVSSLTTVESCSSGNICWPMHMACSWQCVGKAEDKKTGVWSAIPPLL